MPHRKTNNNSSSRASTAPAQPLSIAAGPVSRRARCDALRSPTAASPNMVAAGSVGLRPRLQLAPGMSSSLPARLSSATRLDSGIDLLDAAGGASGAVDGEKFEPVAPLARSLHHHDRASHHAHHHASPTSSSAGAGGRRKSVSFDLAHNTERVLPRDSGKSWKKLERLIADSGLTTPAARAFADYYVCERRGEPLLVVRSPPVETAMRALASPGSPSQMALLASSLSGVSFGSSASASPSLSALALSLPPPPALPTAHHHHPRSSDDGYGSEDDEDDHDHAHHHHHDQLFAMDDDEHHHHHADHSPAASDPDPELIDGVIRTIACSKSPDHPIIHYPEDHNMFVDEARLHDMVIATEQLDAEAFEASLSRKKSKASPDTAAAASTTPPTAPAAEVTMATMAPRGGASSSSTSPTSPKPKSGRNPSPGAGGKRRNNNHVKSRALVQGVAA
ncbi:hypothetical protein H9P43_001251 [Blastocladiella emersonii ATCC 22665]|nr:hypothetical protein H9P43_001251 [Blastocladiella emersonii ATCC 22665]